MDVVLIVLGVLGFGAIVVAVYVFTVAARNYVSAEDHKQRPAHVPPAGKRLVMRNPQDRRSGKPVEFPITVNGIVIPQERRHSPERRMAA